LAPLVDYGIKWPLVTRVMGRGLIPDRNASGELLSSGYDEVIAAGKIGPVIERVLNLRLEEQRVPRPKVRVNSLDHDN